MIRRWAWFLRALRGRLGLLAVCLALAAAGPVAVAAIGASVADGTGREAARLAGAGLAVIANRPLSATEAAAVDRLTRGMARADTADLTTIARTGDRRITVRLVAAGDGFPIDGTWQGDPGPLRSATPAVLVHPAFLRRTGAAVGDGIRLGRLNARIAGTVAGGPLVDGAFSIGPTVLLDLRHLESTGLAGPGSRVGWTRWIDAPDPERARRRLNAALGLDDGDRAEGPFSVARELRVRTAQAVVAGDRRVQERLGRMLGLAAALGCAVGAAGAVVLGRLAGRAAVPDLRLLRVLGATPAQAAVAALGACAVAGLAAGAAGALAGAGLGAAAALALGIPATLPGTGAVAAVLALTTLLPAVAAAGPVRAACTGAPGRPLPEPALWPLALAAGAAALGLGAVGGGEAGLVAAATLGAGAVLAGPLWLLARALGWAGRRLPLAGPLGALGWALRGCARPGGEAVLTGLGLALVASGVAAVICLRSALLAEVVPEGGGPGTFIIDVQPDQVAPLAEMAAAAGATASLRPIIPARLASARRDGTDSEEATFFRRREQRLSWREAAEDGDRTVAGRWIAGPGEASVERRWAERLGIRLGDRLDLIVDGATRSVAVVGLRSVRWTSFRPNFFVYAHRDDLAGADATWILALPAMAGPDQDRLLDAMRAAAPNILPIDVADGVRTALELADALGAALAWVAAAAVGAALAVVAGLVLAGGPRRREEIATARALGAPPGLVPAAHAWQAALLGAAGGALGAVTGIATAALAAAQAEWVPVAPAGIMLLPIAAGGLTAAVTVMLAGRGR